ncbi:MAG: hypothetical protein RL657_1353, partial [Pseudomonadota bacterium]
MSHCNPKSDTMNASEFDAQFRERLNALATSNISDALDSLGITRCAVA